MNRGEKQMLFAGVGMGFSIGLLAAGFFYHRRQSDRKAVCAPTPTPVPAPAPASAPAPAPAAVDGKESKAAGAAGHTGRLRQPPGRLAIGELMGGAKTAQYLFVACKFGFADLMLTGPKTAAELAAPSALHADSVERLMRMLAHLEVFTEDAEGRYGLNDTSKLLTKSPNSMWNWVIHMLEPAAWAAMAELSHSIKTGECAFDKANGIGIFEYYDAHPESSQCFHMGLATLAKMSAPTIADSLKWSQFGTIMDVGGSTGTLLNAILEKHPEVKQGIVFDLPTVIAETKLTNPTIKSVGGSFFTPGDIPTGADAIIMKSILHDWNDQKSTEILNNCRAALQKGKKLLIIEMIKPPIGDTKGYMEKDLCMWMMIVTGGRERTLVEWTRLLDSTGFKLVKAHPTKTASFIIEAERQ